MFNFSQDGVSIYLSLMIMSVLLAIALGLSTIFVSQIKMLRGIGDSVVSFYAADSGIEMALYEDRIVCKTAPCPSYCAGSPPDICERLPVEDPPYEDSDNVKGAKFTFYIYSGYINSIGRYEGVRRAIQITR